MNILKFLSIFSLFSTCFSFYEPINPLNWAHIKLPVSIGEHNFIEQIKIKSVCHQLKDIKDQFEKSVYDELFKWCKNEEEERFFNKLKELCYDQDLFRENDNQLASIKRNKREVIVPIVLTTIGALFTLSLHFFTDKDKVKYSDFVSLKNDNLKLEKMREIDSKLKDQFGIMNKVKSAQKEGFLPLNFLNLFNISSNENYEKIIKLQSCYYMSDKKTLTLKLSEDKIDDNLELLSARPFKVILENSDYCYLEYNGPKNIIFNKLNKTYQPYDEPINNLNSIPAYKNSGFKHYSSINQFKKICSKDKLNKKEFIQIKKSEFFNSIYCYGNKYNYLNDKNIDCPNYVFKLDFGNSLEINNETSIKSETSYKNEEIDLNEVVDNSHFLFDLTLKKDYFKAIEEHHRNHYDYVFDQICNYFSNLFSISFLNFKKYFIIFIMFVSLCIIGVILCFCSPCLKLICIPFNFLLIRLGLKKKKPNFVYAYPGVKIIFSKKASEYV